MDTTMRIEIFKDEEQKLIDKTIAQLREDRRYSTKPSMLHDLILLGCRVTLDPSRKPAKA